MADLVYLIVTVTFFALMSAYVFACARLGRRASSEREQEDRAP